MNNIAGAIVFSTSLAGIFFSPTYGSLPWHERLPIVFLCLLFGLLVMGYQKPPTQVIVRDQTNGHSHN